MNLALIGLSHQQAPIDIREAVTFTQKKQLNTATFLLDEGIDEVVILSTCNRSEIYIATRGNPEEASEIVQAFYRQFAGTADIAPYLYTKHNAQAVEHLFAVSAGLDSAILGEDQILGQVKDALELAMSIGASKKTLNRLFTQAVTSAKEIKTTTRISETPLSMSSIAVKFIKEQLGVDSLSGKTVMLIGMGKMNRLAVNYLLADGVAKLYLVNRNRCKSQAVQEAYPQADNIQIIEFEQRYEFMPLCDVIISATASPHTVLKAELCPELPRNILLMDMAMPRDIDARLGERPTVRLFDIDALKTIQATNHHQRSQRAKEAHALATQNAHAFLQWLDMAGADDTIRYLNARSADIQANALAYLFKKVNLSNREQALVEEVMTSALKKVLREPILNLKKTTDPQQRETCIQTLDYLFDRHKGAL